MVIKSIYESKEEIKLKKQLHEFINKYGLLDARTIKKSEELDKLIYPHQKSLAAAQL